MTAVPPTNIPVTPIYPRAIKVFTTYQDYTDIIWARSINEVNVEVSVIERTLGTNPFQGTPYSTFGGAVQDLWVNKAPSNHTHDHHLLQDLLIDDHVLYIRADGARSFTAPVTGVAGNNPNDLVTLGQLQSLNYANTALVEQLIDNAVANLVTGAYGGPPLYAPFGYPPPHPNWIIKGGIFPFGWTDGSGIIHLSFGSGYPSGVVAVACTKIPVRPGPGYAPAPNGDYNHIETQITLLGASLGGAVVQFSHDYSWQPYMNVALTWLAIGW
jgi:hypothetical protein